MKLALDRGDLISHFVSVDIAPISYPPFSTFGKYINFMKSCDLSKITQRKQADEYLKQFVPVTIKNIFCLVIS